MCSSTIPQVSPASIRQRLSPLNSRYSAQVRLELQNPLRTLLCAVRHAGFISQYEPHGRIYALPDHLPTLHSASSHPSLSTSSVRRSDCLTPAGTIAVDMRDVIVPAQKTIDLQELFKNSQLVTHNEGKSQMDSLTSSTFQSRCRAFTAITGHSIPVRGDWPRLMREFILQACSQSTPSY
jgi:hypothetical protein